MEQGHGPEWVVCTETGARHRKLRRRAWIDAAPTWMGSTGSIELAVEPPKHMQPPLRFRRSSSCFAMAVKQDTPGGSKSTTAASQATFAFSAREATLAFILLWYSVLRRGRGAFGILRHRSTILGQAV
jgi:hypothetical protein